MSKQETIENWAAEIVVDEVVMASDIKKVDDCSYYHAYAKLFKKWHNNFSEDAWFEHINNIIKEL
jgi:hypothetical protein